MSDNKRMSEGTPLLRNLLLVSTECCIQPHEAIARLGNVYYNHTSCEMHATSVVECTLNLSSVHCTCQCTLGYDTWVSVYTCLWHLSVSVHFCLWHLSVSVHLAITRATWVRIPTESNNGFSGPSQASWRQYNFVMWCEQRTLVCGIARRHNSVSNW